MAKEVTIQLVLNIDEVPLMLAAYDCIHLTEDEYHGRKSVGDRGTIDGYSLETIRAFPDLLLRLIQHLETVEEHFDSFEAPLRDDLRKWLAR
jgi:hypothetical protein